MLPVVDIGPLVLGRGDVALVAREIDSACRDAGFFYVRNHGVDRALQSRLEELSRQFFALPEHVKAELLMKRGGRAWRGFFPVFGELTSGVPDRKEGIYFGAELSVDDPRVRAGLPLHGPNLFPSDLPELRTTVLAWMEAMTRLGHLLMEAVARGLGLTPRFFRDEWMRDPIQLFRIFHYPPEPPSERDKWGVGEHTDYGVLTILLQDNSGGLEVRSRGEWISAPPIEGTFLCNIGDMLDRTTGGAYRSTPHRVRNTSGRDRYSYPFFFDPGWDARVTALPIQGQKKGEEPRWDRVDPHAFGGTYGDYLMSKVSKVFPDLFGDVIARQC